jgi:serine/threonine protein kinase
MVQIQKNLMSGSQILDVAMGLEYLHAEQLVHGDLKAVSDLVSTTIGYLSSQANILVTPSGRACISDFGLANIADAVSLQFTHSTASIVGGTVRYQAPEVLVGGRNHFGSDIYAFACVCYEVPRSALTSSGSF